MHAGLDEPAETQSPAILGENDGARYLDNTGRSPWAPARSVP